MTAFRSVYRKRDRGFTFVEVLIVVAVIALLISLTSFAAYQAFLYTKERAIIAEIGLMSAALETYKETRNSYPPCMSAVAFGSPGQPPTPANSFYLSRQAAMNAHTQTGYNNYVFTLGSLATATTSTGAFMYQYYSKNETGRVVKLDMNTIDPAEALVFWLAGFPCPYINNTYIAPKKLIGFCKDQSAPFNLTFTPTMSSDQFLSMRTAPLFDFDESRLYDCDNDGWYEYYTEKPANSSNATPPYIYFDAALYTSWKLPPTLTSTMAPMLGYPPAPGLLPVSPYSSSPQPGWAQTWGIALPYAKNIYTVTGTITWFNPTSYQIIAPGFDRQYSAQIGPNMALLQPMALQPRVLQDTMLPAEPNGYQADRDNFVNFTDQKLGDELSAEAASQLPAGS